LIEKIRFYIPEIPFYLEIRIGECRAVIFYFQLDDHRSGALIKYVLMRIFPPLAIIVRGVISHDRQPAPSMIYLKIHCEARDQTPISFEADPYPTSGSE
jgi:hypothetical protein